MKEALFKTFILVALPAVFCGCQKVNRSPVGAGVRTYERYSDELGRKRDMRLFGKDVIVEPEANDKIRINF